MLSALVTSALLVDVCALPRAIDVSMYRHEQQTQLIVTVPMHTDVSETSDQVLALSDEWEVKVMPLFGIGSFTSDSKKTQKALALTGDPQYQTAGTPESAELDQMLTSILEDENAVWLSKSESEQDAAIRTAIGETQRAGRTGFGECYLSKDLSADGS